MVAFKLTGVRHGLLLCPARTGSTHSKTIRKSDVSCSFRNPHKKHKRSAVVWSGAEWQQDNVSVVNEGRTTHGTSGCIYI